MSEVHSSHCINGMKIAGAVILPNVGGWLGSTITRANLKPWYASLNKPKWNPPNYVFAPMWTSIYSAMGYASYLVYEDLLASGNGFDRTAQICCALYANQLALNWAWTPIFFKYHSLKWVKQTKTNQMICLNWKNNLPFFLFVRFNPFRLISTNFFLSPFLSPPSLFYLHRSHWRVLLK